MVLPQGALEAEPLHQPVGEAQRRDKAVAIFPIEAASRRSSVRRKSAMDCMPTGCRARMTCCAGRGMYQRRRGHLNMRTLASLLAVSSLLLSASGALARELTISHQWPEGTDARDRAARLF